MEQTVIITGASSGIGQAAARRFYEEGYDLVVNSRSRERLAAAMSDFDEDRVRLVVGDVGEEQTARELVQAAQEFGSVDVVVNNAGFGVFKPVEELSREDFEGQLRTNVLGVFFVCKHAVPVMRSQDRGQIINISSMAGKNHFATGTAYTASKFAVQGFTGSLKKELRDGHVKVAALLPGSVDTQFFEVADVPLNEQRHLEPETVAQKILEIAQQPADSDVDEVVLRPALR